MKTRKGFTLIELLIVITIIGILAVALLPRILNAPARARDVSRVAALNTLTSALEQYINDNAVYPVAFGGECLSATSTTGKLLLPYVDAAVFNDPLTTNTFTVGGTIECDSSSGYYYYQSLAKNGISQSAYLLIAGTEVDCSDKNPNCIDATVVKLGTTVDLASDTTGVGDIFNLSLTSPSGQPNVYGILKQ